MSSKKNDKKSAPIATATVAETQDVAAVPNKAPALIAYYAIPAPKGQQSVATPIGAAVAHDDGEGFTLQLNLMPTMGGRILLRVPKAKAAA